MAMRTVISRAMTNREDGARRSIMLADVKTAFLYGNRRVHWLHLVDTWENLNVPCMELEMPR